MAVTGTPGWLGSSAVDNTGQRWMQVAASVLRVGTPFWMGNLVGRSRYDFIINIGSASASNLSWRGYTTSGVPASAPAMGSLVEDHFGIRSFYALNDRDVGQLFISNWQNRNWTVTSQDGNQWVFTPSQGDRYNCNNVADFRNYLNARIGATVGFFIS